MRFSEINEARSNPIEDFKPQDRDLDDLKSQYLPDWEMIDHKDLQAKYVAKDHRHAEKFVTFINRLSERMDHFTEVTQDVAEVKVKTSTFDVKGLTILDFKIALIIDKYAEQMGIEQVRMSGNFGMHTEDQRNPEFTTAKSLGIDLKNMIDDFKEIQAAGPNSSNIEFVRKLKRSIQIAHEQLRRLGYRYDEAQPTLVRKMGANFTAEQLEENLKQWFKQKWVRFGPDGKIRGACARGSEKEGKPKCLPQSKAHSLGKKGRASAAARKRREDPNPERRGAAKNVRTK